MKAMMPMMMPMKQASRERIMRARVASKWAVDKVRGQQQESRGLCGCESIEVNVVTGIATSRSGPLSTRRETARWFQKPAGRSGSWL